MWNLHQQITVDETMVRYKGKYCPIRQFMLDKPMRFDIKVWALVDAAVKYVWTFNVYYGKEAEAPQTVEGDVNMNAQSKSRKGKGKQGEIVVKELTSTLHGRGQH